MGKREYQQYNLLREQMPHGDVMFPLMVHNFSTDCRFAERVSCHWHDEIEILVVTNGRAQVHINNRSYDVQKGSIIFIPPAHLHYMTGIEGVPFDFFAVVFHENLLNSSVNDIIQQKYIDIVKKSELFFPECINPSKEWEKELSDSLLRIRDVFERKESAFQLLVKSAIYNIWYLLYTHSDKDALSSSRSEEYRVTLTKSIIEYIKTNYDAVISVPELSKIYSVSEGHLCRVFKAMTKMSIVEYINFYRISKSRELLRTTGKDIGEIAGMTGFNNISYYNKIFRRYMHMTPSQYRKMNSE